MIPLFGAYFDQIHHHVCFRAGRQHGTVLGSQLLGNHDFNGSWHDCRAKPCPSIPLSRGITNAYLACNDKKTVLQKHGMVNRHMHLVRSLKLGSGSITWEKPGVAECPVILQ